MNLHFTWCLGYVHMWEKVNVWTSIQDGKERVFLHVCKMLNPYLEKAPGLHTCCPRVFDEVWSWIKYNIIVVQTNENTRLNLSYLTFYSTPHFIKYCWPVGMWSKTLLQTWIQHFIKIWETLSFFTSTHHKLRFIEQNIWFHGYSYTIEKNIFNKQDRKR